MFSEALRDQIKKFIYLLLDFILYLYGLAFLYAVYPVLYSVEATIPCRGAEVRSLQ